MLEYLWVDLPGAAERARTLPDPLIREHVEAFLAKGYTIFRGAVPGDIVETILRDLRDVHRFPEDYVVQNATLSKTGYVDPATIATLRPSDRISDVFAISAAARQAIFAKPVRDFLVALYDGPALALQSISFEYGSQQAIHQDTAYVVASEPLSIAAAWIALQDIEQGSGELIFYPGSHRFDPFLFSGAHKHYAAPRDGAEQHKAFLAHIHAQAKQRGIGVDRFLAKKGDVLVWHADLAHGGAKITKPGATRRSLVAHYCPFGIKPNYARRLGPVYHEWRYDESSYFASRHYRLRDLETAAKASIAFDGGVTAARQPAL